MQRLCGISSKRVHTLYLLIALAYPNVALAPGYIEKLDRITPLVKIRLSADTPLAQSILFPTLFFMVASIIPKPKVLNLGMKQPVKFSAL